MFQDVCLSSSVSRFESDFVELTRPHLAFAGGPCCTEHHFTQACIPSIVANTKSNNCLQRKIHGARHEEES